MTGADGADHDVVVIGAGVAGLVAGQTAALLGLDVLVIDRLGAGGQVINVEGIANFPGFPEGISGIELGPALQEQAEQAGAAFMLDEVQGLSRDGTLWEVRCAGTTLRARAVILATGSRLRALEVPGEAEFVGRGVSHCASCDGPFFRGEHVVVAGGGDSALQEALALAPLVASVSVVHSGPEPTAQAALLARVRETSNIGFVPHAQVTAVEGNSALRRVHLRKADGADEIAEAAGLFPFVGLMPNADLARDHVTPDDAGRVPVDVAMRTPCAGLYAAGDVRSGSVCWLAAAAGDGATAAISAHRDLTARAEAG